MTGLTRKIDIMGRIVIPKDFREKLNIKENDYLELFLNSDEIIIKKYSKLDKIKDISQNLTDIIYEYLNAEVFIAERDKILAYSGKYKSKYLNKNISNKLFKSIRRRESLFEKYKKEFEIIDGEIINCSYINETIISNFEEVGILCLYRLEDSVSEMDLKIIKIALSFFSKYLDE